VKHSGVNAVAVVARFPDDDPEDSDCYREGKVFLVCSSSFFFNNQCLLLLLYLMFALSITILLINVWRFGLLCQIL
jgi:hypothetical protein